MAYKKKPNGKNDTGRPTKPIDYETVEKLASIMCTQEEIASHLDISVRTLQRDEEFCHIYKKGMDKGKMSLRRKQYLMAETNPTMAIWLGKQYLGQRDKSESEINQTINRPYEGLTKEQILKTLGEK